MANSFTSPGMNLPPRNFQRQDPMSRINSFNQNGGFNDRKPQFKSLDGRNWETKDQEIRANQEFYRKMMNDSMKKGN